MIIKLYKRESEEQLTYHEAWASNGEITEHWGLVGTSGEQRISKLMSGNEKLDLNKVLQAARQQGFQEIDIDEHRRLIVEYLIEDMGTPADLDKRTRLESRLKNTLGWTGLGDCDGGSTGSGTMEVCCFVVDFATAKSVVEQDLAETEFSNFNRIYGEDPDESSDSFS